MESARTKQMVIIMHSGTADSNCMVSWTAVHSDVYSI